jgi:hypothetical protein
MTNHFKENVQDNIEEGTNQIVLTKRKKWSLMSDITVIRDEAYCTHPVIYRKP